MYPYSMKSVSLRLFLLVCVATMLRADASQAQEIAGFGNNAFASAFLLHLEAESSGRPAVRLNIRRTSRPAIRRASVVPVHPALLQERPSAREVSVRAQRSPAPSGLLRYALFRARSTLPADPAPSLA